MMNAHQTIAAQRRLLDALYTAGQLRYVDYLDARNALADAPMVTCAVHSDRAAHTYARDEHTPLCAACWLAQHAQAASNDKEEIRYDG